MLRLEARNAETPIERKPPWIKTRVRTGPEYTALQHLVKSEGLHTVCQEAGCPNIFECWEDREATFLIGGDQCTRRCDFCQIDTGKPLPLDRDEPRRVAESVAAMGLRYATVTGVARDDQPDGGSWLYAQTAREIHAAVPGCGVELLVPDFNADPAQLGEVFSARPEVFAHNLETVPRIFKRIRPGFRYERSLDVLRQAREAGMVTKSNLILGMGETREEIAPALKDQFDFGNAMQIPGLVKIVVNMGVGQAAKDSKLMDGAVRDLTDARDQSRARGWLLLCRLEPEAGVPPVAGS